MLKLTKNLKQIELKVNYTVTSNIKKISYEHITKVI